MAAEPAPVEAGAPPETGALAAGTSPCAVFEAPFLVTFHQEVLERLLADIEAGHLSGPTAAAALRAEVVTMQGSWPAAGDATGLGRRSRSTSHSPSLVSNVARAGGASLPSRELGSSLVHEPGEALECDGTLLPGRVSEGEVARAHSPSETHLSMNKEMSFCERFLEASSKYEEQCRRNAAKSKDWGQREWLESVFREIDVNGSGVVSKEELEFFQRDMPPTIKEVVQTELLWAIEHADANHDGLLNYHEFLGIAHVTEIKPSLLQKHALVKEALLCLLYFCASPAIFCAFNDDEGRWSIWDALYFATVTMTTVGFGDFYPVNDSMRAFTTVYIIFGICIVAEIVSKRVLNCVEHYETRVKQLSSAMASIASEIVALGAKSQRFPPNSQQDASAVTSFLTEIPKMRCCPKQSFPKLVWSLLPSRKLWTTALLFILPCFIGGVFISFNEEWPLLHGMYWSVVTCTTVGYGDLTLQKESSRIFCCVFLLTAFFCALKGFTRLASLQMELRLEEKRQILLANSLSMDMIRQLGKDGQGVDRCEFVCGILMQLEKLSKADVEPLMQRFDELDKDCSGRLTAQDLRILCEHRLSNRSASCSLSSSSDRSPDGAAMRVLSIPSGPG